MGILFGHNPDSCFNCKHYSGMLGCIKGKRNGSVLQTNICPLYENKYEAREQERLERAKQEEIKRLQRENERLQWEKIDQEREMEQLRRENERLSQETAESSSNHSLSHSEYESYCGSSDGQEELSELLGELGEELEELKKQFREYPESIKDVIDEAIRVMRGLRQTDWEDAIVDNSKLKDVVERVVSSYSRLDSLADSGLFDSDFKKELSGLKNKADTELMRLSDVFKEEINWHFVEGNFNVAFILADCFNLFETEEASDLYKKCKAKYLETILKKARTLIESKQYEDAIDYLEIFEEEEVAKSLIRTARNCLKDKSF